MARMIGRTKSWLVWLAGSALALVFGSAGCGKDERPAPVYGAPPAPPAGKPDKPTGSLEDSKDWKVITDAWDFAKRAHSTQLRKEADARFAAANEAATRLVASGLLLPEEAGLLAIENEQLGVQMHSVRASDASPRETHPAPAGEQKACWDRLARRLPLLQGVVAGGKVHRAAAEKTLANIEADLAVLSDQKKLAELSASWGKKEGAEAAKTRDAVKEQVEKLKKLLDADKAEGK